MMDINALAQKCDLEEIDKKLGDTYWSPVVVAHINDWVVRAAAVKGEYHWHSHQDDELFLVYKGKVIIDTEKGAIDLKTGQVAVIPKGMQHRPRAEERAVILLFEPERLVSTGD